MNISLGLAHIKQTELMEDQQKQGPVDMVEQFLWELEDQSIVKRTGEGNDIDSLSIESPNVIEGDKLTMKLDPEKIIFQLNKLSIGELRFEDYDLKKTSKWDLRYVMVRFNSDEEQKIKLLNFHSTRAPKGMQNHEFNDSLLES